MAKEMIMLGESVNIVAGSNLFELYVVFAKGLHADRVRMIFEGKAAQDINTALGPFHGGDIHKRMKVTLTIEKKD